MTIYATVNSLIDAGSVGTHGSCVRKVGCESAIPDTIWTLISPSGILQGGNPYFVPDFADLFEARTATALRIGKLGKGIAPRFAHRYIDAIAPAIVFLAVDLLQRLRKEGLPWTSAISYDRCLALGKFTPVKYEDIPECCCSFSLSGEEAETHTDTSWIGAPGLEETLAAISRDNTLKTGDIILLGLAGLGPEVTPGMRASLSLNGGQSLAFNIR